MPVIFEKDADKYYDTKELTLMKRGSGLFPAGHNARKDRTGNAEGAGFMDILMQGVAGLAKGVKFISENKETIKGVAEAAGSVISAGSKIKAASGGTPREFGSATTPKTVVPAPVPMVPSASSVDPDVYKQLRETVKEGAGFKYS